MQHKPYTGRHKKWNVQLEHWKSFPWKKVVTTFLTAALTAGLMSATALADPASDFQSNLEKRTSIQEKIDTNQETIVALSEEKADLEESAEELQVKIDEYQVIVDDLTEQVNAKQEELYIRQSELDDTYAEYYARVRNFEEYGVASYWSIIFQATSLENLLSRIDYVEEILRHDEDILAEMEEQMAALNKEQDKLEEMMADQKHAQSELRMAQIKLYNKINKRIEEISALEDANNIYQEELNALLVDSAYLQSAINQTAYSGTIDPKEVYQSCVVNNGMAERTPLGAEIVAFTMQFYGQPYVWGGASPEEGFDCSGLMYYVYAQKGFSLYRVATDQFNNNGYSVTFNDLQAGDMVFFYKANTSKIGHVGMYIGNGMFIHATNRKSGIIISSLYSTYYTTNYAGARRVIGVGE